MLGAILLILILHDGPIIHILANSAGILVPGSQDSWRLATVGAVLKLWGAGRAQQVGSPEFIDHQHHKEKEKKKKRKRNETNWQ